MEGRGIQTELLPNTLRGALECRGLRSASLLVVTGSGMGACFGPDELDVLYQSGRHGVEGHSDTIALLRRAPVPTLVSLGRRHVYEGYTVDDVTRTVRIAAGLGVRSVVLTNAAGGLNPLYRTGDLMLITGFMDLMAPKFTGPFAAQAQGQLPEANPEYRHQAILHCALERGLALQCGVYAWVTGPSYETRAEVRALRRAGADAVGMSTVHEARAALAGGMTVTGISLITNILGDTPQPPLAHTDVVGQSLRSAQNVRTAIQACIDTLKTP